MLASPLNSTVDSAPMLDSKNIINIREGESLYQICIKLQRRLAGVPGFEDHLAQIERREEDGSDPVSSLWQCFREGVPLLAIYNASQPEEGELKAKEGSSPERRGKEAAYLFTKACKEQMNIPSIDIFTLTDLFSDNTTGFVKVTKVVNRVLDLLQMSGKIKTVRNSDGSGDSFDLSGNMITRPPKQMTRRDHILKELVDSERYYVDHLEKLHQLKKELEGAGLPGDSIHMIFLNLNNLLDFAQRFLIRIEQQHELPEADQNWGALFVRYKEPFRQYEPFIANQKRCEITCAREWNNMVTSARTPLMHSMLENSTTLNGFLIKPFQRLTKYPLLLKDLEKQIESEDLKRDLREAIGIIQDVLNQADASIDKETREDAVVDLKERVEDWKGLDERLTGELLLMGTFPVQKEGGGLRNEDKEYHIYLFSRILVMCKDINMAKQKKKGLPATSIRGKPRMSVKGRIFFANVVHITPSTKDGAHTLKIAWKGDRTNPNDDEFVVKFRNEDLMKKWQTMIQTQRSLCMLEKGSTNVSNTQLTSLAGVNLPNPYTEQDEDEDFSRMSATTLGDSDYNMSRNGSSTSLRQRSTTASSSASSTLHLSQVRLRGPTNELGSLPKLNTVQSQGHHPQESYFSPVDRESPSQPASARSSAQSAYAAGYRVMAPPSTHEPNYRNTAPAMGRDNPRGHPYMSNGRHPQRPSLPPGSANSANITSTMNRMRSASSPDIHPHVQQNRKYGENIPAVPSLPPYVSNQIHPAHRGQNHSQSTAASKNLTPGYARPGMNSHGYTYDPSYSSAKLGHAPQHSQDRNTLPAPVVGTDGDNMPSQLKAKVRFNDNYVSMIIPTNITFRTLTDRIDAKLARFTHYAIAAGSVKLRYQDQDGDYILIDSDEAVSEALLDWKETHAENAGVGLNAEIALFAHVVGE